MRLRRTKQTVLNDKTRLFIQSLDTPDKEYHYHSCVGISDISIPKPDKQVEYCASSNEYNQFDILAVFTSGEERGTSSLQTNYTLSRSALKKYADTSCLFDMQIHIGECDKPNNFARFDKALIFKNVEIDNYTLSSVFSATQSERAPITENVSFNFEKMIEVSHPNFIMEADISMQDGQIIDSFTFCGNCNLCNTTGRYFIQLLTCDELESFVRIIYTLDNGDSWKVIPYELLLTIPCSQYGHSNVIQDADNFYAIHLINFHNKTFSQTVNDSLFTIPKSILSGNLLYTSIEKNGIVWFAGTGARIYYFLDNEYERLTHTNLNLISDILSIDSYNGLDFVAGSHNGRFYYGEIDGDVTEILLPTANPVYAIHAISETRFVMSNGLSGGWCYYDGVFTRMKNIYGAITKFAFFDADIGYAISVTANQNLLWQTVDGGKSWQTMELTLDLSHIVTTVTICQDDHNMITIAGRKLSATETQANILDPTLMLPCTDESFVYLAY